jgi:hypothetical protein
MFIQLSLSAQLQIEYSLHVVLQVGSHSNFLPLPTSVLGPFQRQDLLFQFVHGYMGSSGCFNLVQVGAVVDKWGQSTSFCPCLFVFGSLAFTKEFFPYCLCSTFLSGRRKSCDAPSFKLTLMNSQTFEFDPILVNLGHHLENLANKHP